MTVHVWRIAAETKKYQANDISGGGSGEHGGRWNVIGEYVVYAATTRAIAVLETVANLDDGGLPLNRFLVEISVPDLIWDVKQHLDAPTLDAVNPAWSAIPGGLASMNIGSGWYQSMSSAILMVPSVIVPEEFAVLINARHPDAAAITAKTLRRFEFNRVRRF